jgi:hypothetical protein
VILTLLIAGPCESTANHDLDGSGGHQQLELVTGVNDAAYITNVIRSKILRILKNKLCSMTLNLNLLSRSPPPRMQSWRVLSWNYLHSLSSWILFGYDHINDVRAMSCRNIIIIRSIFLHEMSNRPIWCNYWVYLQLLPSGIIYSDGWVFSMLTL